MDTKQALSSTLDAARELVRDLGKLGNNLVVQSLEEATHALRKVTERLRSNNS